MLEHITKHEIAHALGLGRTKFPYSVMSPIVKRLLQKFLPV